jgi:hypothetical protein
MGVCVVVTVGIAGAWCGLTIGEHVIILVFIIK